MPKPEQILKEALSLPAIERAALADALLSSLEAPDQVIDALWAKEAEARLDAHMRGELMAIPLAEVLAKHREGR